MDLTQSLLDARDLTVERGGRELFRSLSVRVGGGELVHLRGANGAGKSTLLRILAGLSRYGFDGLVAFRAPCLFVGHHSAVKELLTPRENLDLHPSGEYYGEMSQIDTALATVGLAGFESVPAGQLSAGQQRRVNLARLFLSKRPLWLLDEPFTALDAAGVTELTRRMVAHAAAGGAVLFTSHQPLHATQPVRGFDLCATAQS